MFACLVCPFLSYARSRFSLVTFAFLTPSSLLLSVSRHSVIGTVAAGIGGVGPCVAGVASGVSQFVERHKDTLNTLGELGGKADKYLLKTDVKEIKNCLMPEDVDGVDSQKSAKAGGLQNIPAKAREAFKQFLLDTGEFVPGERYGALILSLFC